MEVVEVLATAAPPPPSRNKDLSPIAKGIRTKRQRPHSPIPFTITTTTHNNSPHPPRRAPPPRSYFSTTLPHDPSNKNHHPSKHNTPAYGGATRVVGGGGCVYTCKTCNRSFPSFQALGGHRASHKKPKNEKRATIFSEEDDFPSPSMSLNSLSLQLSNASTTTFSASLMKSSPSSRIHECSYCGAEFMSGQALGGHMRKHRAEPVARSSEMIVEEVEPEESKKPRNVGLSLDLNLPALEDEKGKIPQEINQRLRPGFSHHYYSTID
ncbi:zinc finger protein zat5 [Phtheirospermum japonicum]|uniref:Zinc finger protein zat5 n=1 Tax=Phtheirospermum japonicum TaxID=374723 RepID=A0A830C3Q1_9LAMI|nr:zinc finger protein zat5 [Phtheirospermum japonicum]